MKRGSRVRCRAGTASEARHELRRRGSRAEAAFQRRRDGAEAAYQHKKALAEVRKWVRGQPHIKRARLDSNFILRFLVWSIAAFAQRYS